MVQMRQLPRDNPYLAVPAQTLSDHARRLEQSLLEVRKRTPEERLTLTLDCALFLRAVYFVLGRDPKFAEGFKTWGGPPPTK